MREAPVSTWIETTRTHFHAGHRLVTWHPRGILDDALLDEIAYFTQTLENLAEAPFDRYTDLTGFTEIHIQIGHVFEIVKERKQSRAGLPPVKSAFFSNKFAGIGIARMYETLMAGSSIDVRAFQERAAAAAFLGVPEDILVDPDDLAKQIE
jgi:hypothetical protein